MVKRFYSGLTDPGLLRSSNQDSYHIDPGGRFFIVADGMGGHAGGQEASRIATYAIQRYLEDHWSSQHLTKELLAQAIYSANQAILDDQMRHPERADMGTTVVILAFREEEKLPWCAHVGDSRLYRLRGHHLDQVTEDHTWIARAIRDGDLTPAQSRTHPWRHVLSRCLGREDLLELDIQQVEVQPGDRLLLCSDGLTEELSDHLIASHLKSIRSCDAAAAALVNSAKQRGGRDNITVVLVSIQGSPKASENTQSAEDNAAEIADTEEDVSVETPSTVDVLTTGNAVEEE